MIKAEDFVKRADEISKRKTVYLWGGWGQELTSRLIDAKRRQYPSVYYASKVAYLKALVGKGYMGIDCSGLLKMIHWGYPNHKYNNGGMPDTNANGYINMCKNVSTNFKTIKLGEAVWMNGHIGVYAGEINGVKWVIESTPKWKDGVQWVRLDARKWLKHGEMPNVDYSIKEEPALGKSKVTATELNVRTGPSTDNDVVTTLKKDDVVSIEGRDGSWVKITAWVSGKYITQEVLKGQVVSGGDNLNVRSGPNTSYAIVDKLRNGSVITLYDRSGDWWRIGENQFVHGNFVVTL